MNATPKAKILIIDDEAGFRDLLSYELASRGHVTRTAADGEGALELARCGSFDVAISDMAMPKLDGLGVLSGLKKISPQTEVIMITGNATIESAVESMRRGAYDFMTKPFQMEDMLRLIERAIEKSRLQREVGELKELNRTKSEFLANMSHELRTPLNALIGYTALLLDRIYGEIPAHQEQALKRISTNANDLLTLINSILDLSKLRAGHMPIFLEDFDLNDLLEQTLETMQSLADEKSLPLRLKKTPDTILLHSDKTKVKQILINLLGNAIKFTDSGRVEVEAAPDGKGRVEIRIRDSGIGIPEQELGNIFDEFKQVDGSATREKGGTGMGLAITKKLLELLGGDIAVESSLGKGTLFIAGLPLKSEPQKEEIIVSLPFDPDNGQDPRKVVLAIDDDPEVLRLLRDSLSNDEYRLVGALSGDEGISLARQINPFVITLDIMMPHTDGWTVLQRLKGDAGLRSIPVVVLSIIENKALGYALGATDYLVKPFDRRVLLEKLKGLEITRSKRILVVDDEESIAEFFRFGFQNQGYLVDFATHGKEALLKIRKTRPDAVFLDLMLPDISGFDVLDQVEKDPALQGLNIFVITAKDLSQEEKAYLENRTQMVINKGAKNLPRMLDELKNQLHAMADKVGV